MIVLNGCEGDNENIVFDPADAFQHLLVIVETQVRMKPADNVDLVDAVGNGFLHPFFDILPGDRT